MFWSSLLTIAIAAAIPTAPGVVLAWKGRDIPVVRWLGFVLIGFGVAALILGVFLAPASVTIGTS